MKIINYLDNIPIITDSAISDVMWNIDEVAPSLSQYKGEVIFDLLASADSEDTRFVAVQFDGSQFDLASERFIKVDRKLEQFQNKFFREHPKLLAFYVKIPN